MKVVNIKRLPPVVTANFLALFRLIALMADFIAWKAYLRAAFGPEAKIPEAAPPAFTALVFQYVVPVAIAWGVGLLFALAFNAAVKAAGRGLRMEVDE
mgnify:CR=1 FL=1